MGERRLFYTGIKSRPADILRFTFSNYSGVKLVDTNTTMWYFLNIAPLDDFNIRGMGIDLTMDSREFVLARKKLGKTQKRLAELLGTSLKAVHSYEQGWRSIPVGVERQLLFLVSRIGGEEKNLEPCWAVRDCPPDIKERCPAWEFNAGRLCWFVNGTLCGGKVCVNWDEKMKICSSCEVMSSDVLSALSG
jgi:hypothetical protein